MAGRITAIGGEDGAMIDWKGMLVKAGGILEGIPLSDLPSATCESVLRVAGQDGTAYRRIVDI